MNQGEAIYRCLTRYSAVINVLDVSNMMLKGSLVVTNCEEILFAR